MNSNFRWSIPIFSLVSLVVLAVTVSFLQSAPAQNKPSKQAAYPVAKAKANQETATFAAGCFWSLEAMFKQLKGVSKVEPGYAGGSLKNPSYEQVGSGQTGHAETVNIIFDPKVISYRELLKVLFVVHDPTTLNQQGADVGTQYRSVIFTRSEAQKQAAIEVINEVNKSGEYKSPIVTKVQPYQNFYRAEDYHLDYYNLHPTQGYCSAVVAPKIVKFKAKFKDKLKS